MKSLLMLIILGTVARRRTSQRTSTPALSCSGASGVGGRGNVRESKRDHWCGSAAGVQECGQGTSWRKGEEAQEQEHRRWWWIKPPALSVWECGSASIVGITPSWNALPALSVGGRARAENASSRKYGARQCCRETLAVAQARLIEQTAPKGGWARVGDVKGTGACRRRNGVRGRQVPWASVAKVEVVPVATLGRASGRGAILERVLVRLRMTMRLATMVRSWRAPHKKEMATWDLKQAAKVKGSHEEAKALRPAPSAKRSAEREQQRHQARRLWSAPERRRHPAHQEVRLGKKGRRLWTARRPCRSEWGLAERSQKHGPRSAEAVGS